MRLGLIGDVQSRRRPRRRRPHLRSPCGRSRHDRPWQSRPLDPQRREAGPAARAADDVALRGDDHTPQAPAFHRVHPHPRRHAAPLPRRGHERRGPDRNGRHDSAIASNNDLLGGGSEHAARGPPGSTLDDAMELNLRRREVEDDEGRRVVAGEGASVHDDERRMTGTALEATDQRAMGVPPDHPADGGIERARVPPQRGTRASETCPGSLSARPDPGHFCIRPDPSHFCIRPDPASAARTPATAASGSRHILSH